MAAGASQAHRSAVRAGPARQNLVEQQPHAAADIERRDGEPFLEVVRPKHQDDHVERVVTQQARQQLRLAGTALFDGVVPHRRTAVEAFRDDMDAVAKLPLQSRRPARFLRQS